MYTIEFGDPAQPPEDLLALLGPSFREFYSDAPWHERWRCPNCSAASDYGPAGRYSDPQLTQCPGCDTPLEAFWTDQRTLSYFSAAMTGAGAWLLLARLGDELVGWIWGYNASLVEELASLDLPAHYTYVDVICVLRHHRGRLTQQFVRSLQYGLTVNGNADAIVCRTHQAARPVQLLLRATDWVPLEAKSTYDPDRAYWIFPAPSGS